MWNAISHLGLTAHIPVAVFMRCVNTKPFNMATRINMQASAEGATRSFNP